MDNIGKVDFANLIKPNGAKVNQHQTLLIQNRSKTIIRKESVISFLSPPLRLMRWSATESCLPTIHWLTASMQGWEQQEDIIPQKLATMHSDDDMDGEESMKQIEGMCTHLQISAIHRRMQRHPSIPVGFIHMHNSCSLQKGANSDDSIQRGDVRSALCTTLERNALGGVSRNSQGL